MFTDLGLTTPKLYPFTFLLESWGNPQTADFTASSKHYLPSGCAGRKIKFYTFRLARILRPLTFPCDLTPVALYFFPEWNLPLCFARLSAQHGFLTPPPSPAPQLVSPHTLPWQPLSLGCPPPFNCEQTLHPTPVGRLFTNSFLPQLKLDLSKDTSLPCGPLTFSSGSS